MIKIISNTIPTFGVYIQRYITAISIVDKEKNFILDVGCGDGGISNFFTRCGKTVIAMDSDKNNRGNFTFVVANAEKLPFKNSAFEQIFCLDVLEHIKNDKMAAKEMSRVLKKKASIVITTPSEFWKYPYYNFMKFITPSEKSVMNLFGHVRKGYSPSQIKKMFNGFKIEEMRYFVNKLSTLFYDLEYSKLFVLKNIILRVLALPLFINFKLSRKDWGTSIALRLVKD